MKHYLIHCLLRSAAATYSLKLEQGRLHSRVGGGPGTFFSTHGNHLPCLSGVHGLKDFLWSAHLHESFGGRIYTY